MDREGADRAPADSDRLEDQSKRVGRQIEETRRDWESKEADSSVPGAQPDPGEDEEDVAGVETGPGERGEPAGPSDDDEDGD